MITITDTAAKENTALEDKKGLERQEERLECPGEIHAHERITIDDTGEEGPKVRGKLSLRGGATAKHFAIAFARKSRQQRKGRAQAI